MTDESNEIERRKFLCVMGATGATVAVGCGTGTSTPADGGTGTDTGGGADAPAPMPFVAGAVTDHAMGVFKLYGMAKLVVGRDAMGFFAYSIVCPHEGYDVAFRTADGMCGPSPGCTTASTMGATRCSSGHGGVFDANGVRTAGPPMRDLTHYQVTISGGMIQVNRQMTVPVTARTAP